MRIECPACAAVYEVPAERLAPGRRTRCGRCGEAWAPIAALAESAAEPHAAPHAAPDPAADPLSGPSPESPSASFHRDAAEPVEESRPRLVPVAPPPLPASPSSAWVGWLASVLILAALGWGGYAYRGQVMSAWPPSVRLYSALGLTG